MRIPAPHGKFIEPRFSKFSFSGLSRFQSPRRFKLRESPFFGKLPIYKNLSLSLFLISYIMSSIWNMYIIPNRQQNARVFLKKFNFFKLLKCLIPFFRIDNIATFREKSRQSFNIIIKNGFSAFLELFQIKKMFALIPF